MPPQEVDVTYLSAMLDGAFDAIITKDTDGIVRTWNPAAELLFGWKAEEIVGKSIRLIIPDDRQHEEDSILARVKAGEIIPKFETVRQRKDGTPMPIAVTVSPIRDRDGRIIGASKIAHDISDELALRALLKTSDDRFRALAENIAQLAWMADGDGWIFWYNKRWFDYTGTTLEQMEGWGWKAVHHPDHIDRVVERLQRSWDTGAPWEDTFPLRSAQGEYRWFLSRAMPIRDDEGRITLWCGTNTDVTEQREKEQQIEFLLGEMNHRTKNLLTMIQALVRRTLTPANEEFSDSFERRIRAIGANLDVLTRRNWTGARIEDVVTSQLSYFQDLIGERIHLDGDRDTMVGPTAAEVIGLAIHELATNAGKYGALSNETGQLTINWELASDGDDPRFVLCWTECDGPTVSQPARQGFGSTVIARNPQFALGARVTMDYRNEGLVWTLDAPLDRVLPTLVN